MSSHPDNRTSSKRLTVGFLSERASYASEALIFRGAEQAAEQYNMNLIYFAPLEDRDEADHYGYTGTRPDEQVRLSHDRLKAYLDAFELDGLFTIGWARAFNDANGPYLLDRLKTLPMVTIGKSLSGEIPSVIMQGGPYVKELALHLAGEHQKRHIAYICPWSEDERLDSYTEAMQASGQYDEQLIVRTADLDSALDMDKRMRQAAAILLDQRRLPVDAIMVMSAYECTFMLEELRARGQRVPEDIALVCYEDDPVIANAEPSITTIDYPYHKLGYAACELLAKQLAGHRVPAVTEIATTILYRDSCGCTVNNVKPMQLVLEPPSLFGDVAADRSAADIGSMLRRGMEPDHQSLDYERMAESFLSSIRLRTGGFLEVFSREINRLRGEAQASQGLHLLVDRFREAMLPTVSADRGRYELAEALWFGARHILNNYRNSLALTQGIREMEENRIVNHIYQHLQEAEHLTEVPKVLNQFLGWLQLPSICILVNPPEEPQPEASRMFFSYGEELECPQDADMAALYRSLREQSPARFSLIASPLLMNGELLGYVWAKPGSHRTNTITSLFDQIGSAIKNAQVQEESREKEAQLAYYANVDSLTRLFNRRCFYDTVSANVAAGQTFSVLYIDIDGFKQVNDTHGHDAGDLLLVQLADRLRHTLSDGAFPLRQAVPRIGLTEMSSIFRLGGDEFTALLRTVDIGEAADYAERLRSVLRQPYLLGNHSARVSASIGIARHPHDAADADRLLKLADLAMYRAKENKDQYRFHDEHL